MIWLLLLPAVLVAAVALTSCALGSIQRAVRPKECPHPFQMYGRCGQCGTPM